MDKHDLRERALMYASSLQQKDWTAEDFINVARVIEAYLSGES